MKTGYFGDAINCNDFGQINGNIILYLKTYIQGKKFLFCSISINDSSSRNSPI